MPFTPSHVAAVLPLLGRGGLVPAALVIGSMAPDLPYYLQLGTDASLTHTALGVVTVDLLMAWLAFAAWQAVVAPSLLAVAPAAVRARLAAPATFISHVATPRAFALLLGSLLIGDATHVVWDAFTHVDRWGTNAIPWLTEQHGRLDGYRWAQYASSALGLLAVGAFAAWWWRSRFGGEARVDRTGSLRAEPTRTDRTSPAATSRRAAVAFWVAVTVAVVMGAVAGVLTALASDAGLRQGVFRALVWSGGAGLLTLLVASAAVAGSLRRQRSLAPGR